RNVRFAPKVTEVLHCSEMTRSAKGRHSALRQGLALFDHLVGWREQVRCAFGPSFPALYRSGCRSTRIMFSPDQEPSSDRTLAFHLDDAAFFEVEPLRELVTGFGRDPNSSGAHMRPRLSPDQSDRDNPLGTGPTCCRVGGIGELMPQIGIRS